MREWPKKDLDSVVDIDKRQLSSGTKLDFQFFYIDIGSVTEGHIEKPSFRTPYREAPSRARKIIHRNDILLSTVRPNLRGIAYFGEEPNDEYIASTGFAVLSEKTGFNSRFLYHSLLSDDLQRQMNRLAVGSNYPALSTKDVKGLKLDVPKDQKTQQKIAKILSTCDEVIEKTEAAIAKYEAIKKGMMHDLFTRGIDVKTGKLRPAYEDAPHLYKESELGMIPKEWEEGPLRDYLAYISYGFTNPMPETEEGPFMVTAANVINGVIDYPNTRLTSKELFETLLTDKSRPRIGDLLLTKDGTLGRIAIVDRDNVCINQSVALLRFRNELDTSFFRHLLESEAYQNQMIHDAGGSTIKHIYITIVDKMPVAIPRSLSERDKILSVVSQIIDSIQLNKLDLKKSRKLKSGLMQDLLTGKVEVQVDEVEQKMEEHA